MTRFEKENVFTHIFSFRSVSGEIKPYLAPETAVSAERNLLKCIGSECDGWKGHRLGADD